MSKNVLGVHIASKRQYSGDCHRNTRKTHPECDQRRNSKKNVGDRENRTMVPMYMNAKRLRLFSKLSYIPVTISVH